MMARIYNGFPEGGGGGGSIIGSTGSSNNAIITANGTGGNTIQGSSASVDNSGNITAATIHGNDIQTAETLSGISAGFNANNLITNFSMSSTLTNDSVLGFDNQIFITGANGFGVNTILASIQATSTNRSDAAVNQIVGFSSHIGNQTSIYGTNHTGSVGRTIDFYAKPPDTSTSSDVITDAYGLLIDPHSTAAGVAQGHGIYQNGSADDNFFAGPTQFALPLTAALTAPGLTSSNGTIQITTSSGQALLQLVNTHNGSHLWDIAYSNSDALTFSYFNGSSFLNALGFDNGANAHVFQNLQVDGTLIVNGTITPTGGFATGVSAPGLMSSNGMIEATTAGTSYLQLVDTNVGGSHEWLIQHTDTDLLNISHWNGSGFINPFALDNGGNGYFGFNLTVGNAGSGGTLLIDNVGSAPATPSGGGVLYSTGGQLHVKDTSGNDVNLSASSSTTASVWAGATSITKASGNPLLSGGGGTGYNAATDREFRIWFARGSYWVMHDGWTTLVPSTAVSTLGIASCSTINGSWTDHGKVIDLDSTSGNWGHGGQCCCGIYYDTVTDELWIFVSAMKGSGQLYSGPFAITLWHVGPGLDWTNPANYVIQNGGNPVLVMDQPQEGSTGVYAPNPLKMADGTFALFYSSSASAYGTATINRATSPTINGTWTKDTNNPKFVGCETPCVIQLPSGGLVNFSDVIVDNINPQLNGTGNVPFYYGAHMLYTQDPTGASGWGLVPDIFTPSIRGGTGAWDYPTMGSFQGFASGSQINLVYSGGGVGPPNEFRSMGLVTLTPTIVTQTILSAQERQGGGILPPQLSADPANPNPGESYISSVTGQLRTWNPVVGAWYSNGTVSDWTLDPGLSFSLGNVIVPETVTSTVYTGYLTAPDTHFGNVTLSALVQVSGGTATNNEAAIFARASSPPTVSGGSLYTLNIEFGTANTGLTLVKRVTGTFQPAIASAPITPAFNVSYLLIFSLNGSTLNGYLQRQTDGMWLKPDGTWQSSQIAAVSVTDTDVTGPGVMGVQCFYSGTPPIVATFSNFTHN